MDLQRLKACQARLGYPFSDRALLSQALTHSSGKTDTQPSNERLEFLGDAVLGLIISGFLFEAFPLYDEGELTKIKSVVVSSKSLARETSRLGLMEFFTIGKGMANQGQLPVSILANVFEAIVAAIYLDGGLRAAQRFVLDKLMDQIEAVVSNQHRKNYKSLLQHHCQKHMNLTPTYRVVKQEGPDHVKSFQVVAVVGDREYDTGWGRSKKEAEQKAAEATLKLLLAEPKSGTEET
jgi:ribonuclease-3